MMKAETKKQEQENKERDGLLHSDSASRRSILDTIDCPKDLGKLNIPKLTELAEEIRERIITVVSRNGGHLAPSLGVVELTIALHYVFDAPADKIIWDVGHQAYAHKLLTGRRTVFDSLRQYKGMSGFLRRDESPYDVFGGGHSSTSISAALGIASARDLKGEGYHVVAVIGDGAMGAGLAFEGLNNAGVSQKNLIVVLNDNQMCISPNVGALARHFTTIITSQSYKKLKADIWELTGLLPRGTGRVRKAIREIDESIKALIVPGGLFEKMGFRYIGPIDGHNLAYLIRVLRSTKEISGPVLVHVRTVKGKGYHLAEADASKFHGLDAFDPETGLSKSGREVPTYSEIFGKTLVEFSQKRQDIVAITAAMTAGTGLSEFAQQFPRRFFDVGIAEEHAVTFAAGLAVGGYKPVVAIYSTFLQRAYDQIIHDVALQKLPVVFAVDRAGLVGEDGPTHHGSFDLSFLRQIPDMITMAPADGPELRAMLKWALDYRDGPIALRYPRGAACQLDSDVKTQPIRVGKSVALSQGKEAVILAVGSMVRPALEAARLLGDCSVGVVNMRFVKPLDEMLLRSIYKKQLKIVTVEENILAGGFGSAVMEFYEQNGMVDVKLVRMGIPDRFIEHGSKEILLMKLGLDGEGIAKGVRKFIEEKAAADGLNRVSLEKTESAASR